MVNRTLIKTDRNGTKYYNVTCSCGKCGGNGYISQFYFNAAGLCFNCNGSGVEHYTEKEYTPEYEAKLIERRAKAAEKKRAEIRAKANEINAKFFADNNFDSNGIWYVVLGNTYEIKEQLKSEGAKFTYSIGWHFDHVVSYPTAQINVDDVFVKNSDGIYSTMEMSEAIDKIKAANEAAKKPSASKFLGNVGERLEIKVKYIGSYAFESGFGSYYAPSVSYIHSFRDENGNAIIWKSANYIDADENTEMMIKGTVKDHSEYKGEKQTVLTRCKIN